MVMGMLNVSQRNRGKQLRTCSKTAVPAYCDFQQRNQLSKAGISGIEHIVDGSSTTHKVCNARAVSCCSEGDDGVTRRAGHAEEVRGKEIHDQFSANEYADR